MKKKWLLPVFAAFMLFTTAPGENNTAEAASPTELIQKANQYQGIPYRWGGTTTAGFDCSGFTQRVFSDIGVNIGRTTWDQYARGTSVSKSNLKTGDLVFFNTAGPGSLSHVGIYVGNGKMIHSGTSTGVGYASINDPYYWGSRYAGAKRMTNLEEVKEVAIDTAKYATRGEVAYQIAKALGLDTSDPIVDSTQIKDVKPTHEYAGAIEATRKAGIFSGDAEGKFNPSSLITRAQAAKVLTIAFGLQEQGEAKAFTDVPADHWAHSYVSTLANNEITTGKTNGSFGLNEHLTKEHLKLFIERSVK